MVYLFFERQYFFFCILSFWSDISSILMLNWRIMKSSFRICFAVAKFRGHKNATFYVKTSLSPDDRFLLGGSSDFNAYVWRVDHVTNPESGRTPVIALEGHSNEVTGVAWSPTDICRLVTLSDDNTVWIWRLNQCRSQDLGVNNELGDVVGRTRRLCAGKGTYCFIFQLTRVTLGGVQFLLVFFFLAL
jgi:WD40 repeat protein